jgi:hypothetical protein
MGALVSDLQRLFAPHLQAGKSFVGSNLWIWYAAGSSVLVLSVAVITSRSRSRKPIAPSGGNSHPSQPTSEDDTGDQTQGSASSGVKVETLRRTTPEGNHVISFVSPTSSDPAAELVDTGVEVKASAAEAQLATSPAVPVDDESASPAAAAEEAPPSEEAPSHTDEQPVTNATLSGTPAGVLLMVKETCMKQPNDLNWAVQTPLVEWKAENVVFDTNGGGGGGVGGAAQQQVKVLDLGVKVLQGGWKVNFELKLDLQLLSPLVLGPSLVSLVLEGNNGVSGSIKVLEACPRLEDCMLGVTSLVGDISVFQHCPNIKHISLGGGRSRLPITGDVGVFSYCPDLVSLKVFKGALSGDVGAFSSTPNLEHLNIPKTAVKGDVGAFASCLKLKVCTLSLTRVKGCIKSFEGCSGLTHLSLRGANGVTGFPRDLTAALPDCTVVV